MLIDFDKNTLGQKGKRKGGFSGLTVIYLTCDNCNEKDWKTNWNNYEKRKDKNNDYCPSCKNRLGITNVLGMTHSDEFKEKKRQLFLTNNPMNSKESRRRISVALKGRSVPWLLGKKRPEHAKKMREFMNKVWDFDNNFMNDYRKKLVNGRRFQHSKLHDEVKDCLIENNLYGGFESEYQIGKLTVDEFSSEKNLIIEINGDYFHANPALYKKDDIIERRRLTAKEIWMNDLRRNYVLKRRGYKISVIWEHDFRKNREEMLIKIKEFINE